MEKLNPLGEQDLTRINDAIERLDQARELMDRAREAGFNFDAQRQRAEEARSKLLRIKQTFFPGR